MENINEIEIYNIIKEGYKIFENEEKDKIKLKTFNNDISEITLLRKSPNDIWFENTNSKIYEFFGSILNGKKIGGEAFKTKVIIEFLNEKLNENFIQKKNFLKLKYEDQINEKISNLNILTP